MPHEDHKHREPAEQLLGGFASGRARWALVIFSGFFTLLFLLAWLIRYPDIFTIRVMVQATDRVDRFYAVISDQIADIPVQNGQQVDSGAVLLVWKTSASWEDVVALAAMNPPTEPAGIQQVDALELGELEGQWALALSRWEAYQSELQTARAARLSPATLRQLALLENMEASLTQRRVTLSAQADLAEATRQRYARLAEQNTVSQEALAGAEANFLEKRAAVEAIESEFLQVAIQREALEKGQLELALQDNKSFRQKKEDWEQEWRMLMAMQRDWAERHLTRARHAGEVRFSRPLKPLQWVEEGEATLAVSDGAAGSGWQAQGWLPARGAGRVAKGAEVELRLDAFPYEEYGSLQGEVSQISPLSENESFLVEIALPDSLITETGRILPMGPEIPATARIYTSKKRLLIRLLEGLKRL
ncbi:MAG: HlyD family efflux transporter periplasmic adaptor subunit [Saprospirales bacterium]|nr:HlyD family efflux transporter periplasmic adaptor subunit [Saprospirales bacterium]